MRKKLFNILLVALAALAGTARAATEVSVSSPDGKNKVTVTNTDDHKMYYSVTRGGRTLVAKSLLGMQTVAADFSKNVVYKEHSEKTVDKTYSLPTGKTSTCRDYCKELSVTAQCGIYEVVYTFRAYNDGVAFRYTLGNDWDLTMNIEQDLSEVVVPGYQKSWAMAYIKTYETFFLPRTWSEMQAVDERKFCAPVLVQTDGGDDAWVMVTNSAIDGNACMSAIVAGDADHVGTFTFKMPGTVEINGDVATSWHTMFIGSLGDMVASTLNENLNAPSKVADTSWVKAGLSSWDWGGNDGVGFGSSSDMPVLKQYIDMAAEMQWPYYTLDGGWGGHPNDAPEIAQYAISKGVKPWIWFHQNEFGTTKGEIRNKLKTYADMGYVGIKVDFWEDDSQACMQKVENLLVAAASLKLMVNLHGFTMINGLRRTYPNLIASEGVYGDEQYLFNPNHGDPVARHNISLVFTRNVMGPMDYTPVELATKEGRVRNAMTWSHQLALATLFESGIQTICDSYNNILPSVGAPLLKGMPASWDETRLLEGQLEGYATLMRRSGDDYYVSSVSVDERTADIKLNFLPAGEYTAQIWRDGTCVSDIAYESRKVSAASVLSVHVAKGGGFTVRISKKPVTAPEFRRYEFEDGTYTGKLTLRTDDLGNCSGGKYLGNVQGGGMVTINDVEAPVDGSYNMTLFYISADERSLVVGVNGKNKVLSLPKNDNGLWTSNGLMVYTAQVDLKKGNNTLTFRAANAGNAPDLDRFVVSPTAETIASGIGKVSAKKKAASGKRGVYTIAGQYAGGDLGGLASGLYVANGRTVLVK